MDLKKFTHCKGLPGGPNENAYSVEGYKADSPDRFNPFNIINSGNITMANVPHPVFGIDNKGNAQLMTPGNNYQFPGNQVFEVPFRQNGGEQKLEIGYREPLSGETRPEQEQSAFALLANQYGNINYFAEMYNKLRDVTEESYLEDPKLVDAHNNLVDKTFDPDYLSKPYVSLGESRNMAKELNRRIRKEHLPYQKVRRNAFYNPDGFKNEPSFQDGGYIDMDLTDDEIMGLRHQGYWVEEL